MLQELQTRGDVDQQGGEELLLLLLLWCAASPPVWQRCCRGRLHGLQDVGCSPAVTGHCADLRSRSSSMRGERVCLARAWCMPASIFVHGGHHGRDLWLRLTKAMH